MYSINLFKDSYYEFYNDKNFDYMDDYNEMFGWRSLPWDSMKADMAVRDYAGEIIETLEFIPEMSTSIE